MSRPLPRSSSAEKPDRRSLVRDHGCQRPGLHRPIGSLQVLDIASLSLGGRSLPEIASRRRTATRVAAVLAQYYSLTVLPVRTHARRTGHTAQAPSALSVRRHRRRRACCAGRPMSMRIRGCGRTLAPRPRLCIVGGISKVALERAAKPGLRCIADVSGRVSHRRPSVLDQVSSNGETPSSEVVQRRIANSGTEAFCKG